LDSTEYLYLSNGVKRGPVSATEVVELIDLQEVKPDTLVSADGGKSWHRAYFYPQFDRRSKNGLRDEDILLPTSDAMEKSGIFSIKPSSKRISINLQTEDSLSLESGLLQSKKTFEKERDEEKQQRLLEQEQTLTQFSVGKIANTFLQEKKKIFAFLGIALFLVALSFNNPSTSSPKSESRELSPVVNIPNNIKNKPTIKYEDLTPPNNPIPESTLEATPVVDNIEPNVEENFDEPENNDAEYSVNEDEDNAPAKSRKPAAKSKKIVITHGPNQEKAYGSENNEDSANSNEEEIFPTEEGVEERVD
jgi:hypothetical protein